LGTSGLVVFLEIFSEPALVSKRRALVEESG
jgi:hypothetical protein